MSFFRKAGDDKSVNAADKQTNNVDPAFNTHFKQMIFLRVDNNEKVFDPKITSYQTTPLLHLNISSNSTNPTPWENSGFLSAFRLTTGSWGSAASEGTRTALTSYAQLTHATNVQFILLNIWSFNNVIHLTGGAQVAPSDEPRDRDQRNVPNIVIVKGEDGTDANSHFVFDNNNPQVFSTTGVSNPAENSKKIYQHEYLLGGNWTGFALTCTLPFKEALALIDGLNKYTQKYCIEDLLFDNLSRRANFLGIDGSTPDQMRIKLEKMLFQTLPYDPDSRVEPVRPAAVATAAAAAPALASASGAAAGANSGKKPDGPMYVPKHLNAASQMVADFKSSNGSANPVAMVVQTQAFPAAGSAGAVGVLVGYHAAAPDRVGTVLNELELKTAALGQLTLLLVKNENIFSKVDYLRLTDEISSFHNALNVQKADIKSGKIDGNYIACKNLVSEINKFIDEKTSVVKQLNKGVSVMEDDPRPGPAAAPGK